MDYYGFVEVLELRICASPPALHVAGQLSAYRNIQHALVPASLNTAALGGSLEGFASCVILPSDRDFSVVTHPS